MQRDIEFMEMPRDVLVLTWQTVVRDAIRARSTLEDEVSKRVQVQVSRAVTSKAFESNSCSKTEHLKRTFDYEPFIKAFVTELHNQGLFYPILGLDDGGRKAKEPSLKKQRS